MKRLILLAAFAAGTAVAQSADISGAQLISGDADARLQQLAREAATSNRKLIISAPEYWHDMILEQVRRGGGDRLQVEVRDSFAEAVMVRSDVLAGSATPAPPAPAAAAVAAAQPVATTAPAPAPAPTPAPAPAARPTPPAPTPAAPVAARIPSAPAAAPAPAATANRAQPAVAAAAPATRAPQTAPTPASRPAAAAAPRPASASAAAAPTQSSAQGVTTDSAQAQVSAIKRGLEASLTEGEPITRTLRLTQLEPKDLLFVRDGVVAVLRRISLRKDWFWLEDDIELRRVELRELGPNRYEVSERLRPTANPRLRPLPSSERAMFAANELEKHAAEREQLERRYNGGNRITATLLPTQLKQRDVIYVGDELSVVVRANGLVLERYWLVGRIDLARPELLKDGNNKYRVVGDIRQ